MTGMRGHLQLLGFLHTLPCLRISKLYSVTFLFVYLLFLCAVFSAYRQQAMFVSLLSQVQFSFPGIWFASVCHFGFCVRSDRCAWFPDLTTVSFYCVFIYLSFSICLAFSLLSCLVFSAFRFEVFTTVILPWLQYSGIWRRVIWYISTDVSKESPTSIIMTLNPAGRPTRWYLCTRLHGVTSQKPLIVIIRSAFLSPFPFVHPSIYFSIYLSVSLSIYLCLSICLSVSLSLFICLSTIYLYIYLSLYLSVYLSIYYLSMCLSICLSVSLSLFICLSTIYLSIYIYLSLYLSVYLSIYLYIYLYTIYLCVSLYVYLSVCLSLSLFICLSTIYLSIYISVSLFICLSLYLSVSLSVYLSIYLPIYLSADNEWYTVMQQSEDNWMLRCE
jgi:hypothetical protein